MYLPALEVVLIIIEYFLLLLINLKPEFSEESYSDYNLSSSRSLLTSTYLAIQHIESNHYWIISVVIGGAILFLFLSILIR